VERRLPTAAPPAALQPKTAAPISRTWSRRLFVLGLTASFVAVSLGVHSVFSGGEKLIGIVQAQNLNLRTGAGESFASKGWILGGTRVRILRVSDDGDWLEVETVYQDFDEDGLKTGRGWVGKAFVKITEEETP
jgi:hypothetical protein